MSFTDPTGLMISGRFLIIPEHLWLMAYGNSAVKPPSNPGPKVGTETVTFTSAIMGPMTPSLEQIKAAQNSTSAPRDNATLMNLAMADMRATGNGTLSSEFMKAHPMSSDGYGTLELSARLGLRGFGLANLQYDSFGSMQEKFVGGALIIAGANRYSNVDRNVKSTPSAASKGAIALDNNALIAGLEKGNMSAIDKAIAGKDATISITAIKEFLVKGDKSALRKFMVSRGIKVGSPATTDQVSRITAQAGSLGGRVLHAKDAQVLGSALKEKAELLTADKRFGRLYEALGGVWSDLNKLLGR